MNLFTALLLSTRQQAMSSVTASFSLFSMRLNGKQLYRLVVSDNDTAATTDTAIGLSKPYRFEIFHVTYPDEKEGTWGDPKVACDPHVSKFFSREELLEFCEQHGFGVDSSWEPIENV